MTSAGHNAIPPLVGFARAEMLRAFLQQGAS